MFTYTKISSALGKQQDLALLNGFTDLPGGVDARQDHSIIIEANYNIHVLPGVDFQPDFQYYINPNAQKNIPDAALLGFKLHVEIF